jgi:hypothetical protein
MLKTAFHSSPTQLGGRGDAVAQNRLKIVEVKVQLYLFAIVSLTDIWALLSKPNYDSMILAKFRGLSFFGWFIGFKNVKRY